MVSFDGSARLKMKRGAYRAVVREILEWMIVAASGYTADLTANEAEYRGLLLRFEFLEDPTRGQVIIWGDLNLAIRQMRG